MHKWQFVIVDAAHGSLSGDLWREVDGNLMRANCHPSTPTPEGYTDLKENLTQYIVIKALMYADQDCLSKISWV